MKLRNRLALISSLVFGVIFGMAAIIIYWSFQRTTQKNIINDLKKTCLISGIYYLEKDEQSLSEHNEVKLQFEELIDRSMVAVIDEANEVQFGQLFNDSNITEQRIQKVRSEKRFSFHSRDHFYYGMFYKDNQGDFVVIVKEDNTGYKQMMNRLLLVLISVLLIAWVSIVIISVILSKIAYRPIKRVIKEMNARTLDNLANPIPYTPTHDEVQDLITTYNNLLSRVNNVMKAQKNFVTYVSHEFKTPLTSISVALEVFSQKKRSSEEYQEVSIAALNNVYELERILSNMMILAGLKGQETPYQLIRIDEIIWDLIDRCKEQFPCTINVEISVTDYQKLEFKGSNTQLNIAIFNILENSIKYSDHLPIDILLFEKEEGICLSIRDRGMGIDTEDLPFVKEAFYRGKNVQPNTGSGVGLSLAQMIFDEHGINFELKNLDKGTEAVLTFKTMTKKIGA